MICEICEKNQATTMGLVESESKYLCGACYKKFVTNDSFVDILSQVDKQTEIDKFCPNCGTTLKDIKKGQMFGCQKCYETFFDLLNTTCEKSNDFSPPKLYEVKQKINDLNDLIERALNRSDFETANKLISKINTLKEEYGDRI